MVCFRFYTKQQWWKRWRKKYQHWTYILQKIDLKWIPKKFNRKTFEVQTNIGLIDIWKKSIS